MKNLRFILSTVLLSLAVIWITLEGWALKQFLVDPLPSLTQDQIVEVPPGASAQTVANLLYKQKIVHHPNWFRWYLRLQGKAGSLQTGEFLLKSGWTVDQVINALVEGKNITYPVTFISGETLQTSLDKLAKAPKLHHRLDQQWENELRPLLQTKGLGKGFDPNGNLEGLFLPETYFYTAGDTDLDVMKRAHEALMQVLMDAWQGRQKGLPLKTPYEALILASIVEKESAHADERPTIAGVFVNRLRKGMRLQSDPTVIYGMGARYDGNIRKKDLQTKTAYNTYRISGLPPTPIALASAEAIRAVMHPAATQALYFVADGDGQHRFSNTLEEHNRAVRDFLKTLKQKNR